MKKKVTLFLAIILVGSILTPALATSENNIFFFLPRLVDGETVQIGEKFQARTTDIQGYLHDVEPSLIQDMEYGCVIATITEEIPFEMKLIDRESGLELLTSPYQMTMEEAPYLRVTLSGLDEIYGIGIMAFIRKEDGGESAQEKFEKSGFWPYREFSFIGWPEGGDAKMDAKQVFYLGISEEAEYCCFSVSALVNGEIKYLRFHSDRVDLSSSSYQLHTYLEDFDRMVSYDEESGAVNAQGKPYMLEAVKTTYETMMTELGK